MQKEQRVSENLLPNQAMCFTQFFFNCRPKYFDVLILHSGVLAHSAFAALRGEIEKDAWHKELVEMAGGESLLLDKH